MESSLICCQGKEVKLHGKPLHIRVDDNSKESLRQLSFSLSARSISIVGCVVVSVSPIDLEIIMVALPAGPSKSLAATSMPVKEFLVSRLCHCSTERSGESFRLSSIPGLAVSYVFLA